MARKSVAQEALRNEFSWSRSRDRMLADCPRRYFFAYYGAWGGWERDADPRRRRTYVLKQLKSRQVWAGEVVHGVAERALRDLQHGVAVARVEEVVQWALARMRRDFRSSRDGRYWQRPKSLALFEHEYGVQLGADDWKENAEHVAACIRHLFTSDVYERLRRFPPDDFLEIESLTRFSAAGTPVWVKLDCCLRAGRGVFVIDWKTGRADPESHAQQLACYALYAAQKWGVEPRDIQTLVYDLALQEGRTYSVTAETVSQARREIAASAERMKSYLVDAAANEPREESQFPLVESERACRWCNFRAVCPRFGEAGREAGRPG